MIAATGPVYCLLLLSMFMETLQQRRKTPDRPNIILFITDDQDVQLGSMEYMQKTLRIFRESGTEFVNGFVTTPICCPSRTSILTGLYVHNHHVHSNKENCTGTYWTNHLEPKTFAPYLLDNGYRTGYFGKYLNEYNGTYVPPGWTEWMGLVKNSRFYNYTINYNGRRMKHGDNYFDDYFTDLVVNDSINFFKRSVLLFPHDPIMMVLSFPAPHGPEDPAPQYSTLFDNNTRHRTPSWNYAPNPDKQWLLRHTGKMEPVHVAFTDFLHRRRLQTLQSVDDAVAKLYRQLAMMGELNNTYLLYTSDHGYHLGQFGLIKGKTLPYDFDVKVPFFAYGPKVPARLRIKKPVANIDIAPTILDMAGLTAPEHMDGRSFFPLLLGELRKPWRDTVLIERGIRPKLLKLRDRLARQQERFSKEMRIQMECGRTEYQAPCKPSQVWECRKNELNRWRIFKCRSNVGVFDSCPCRGNESGLFSKLEPMNGSQITGERTRRSVGFDQPLLNRLSEWERMAVSNDLLAFVPEDVMDEWANEFFNYIIYKEIQENGWHQGIFDALEDDLNFESEDCLTHPDGLRSRSTRSLEEPAGFVHDKNDVYSGTSPTLSGSGVRTFNGCLLFPNDTVSCRPDVYNSLIRWKQQKLIVNGKIRTLRSRLQGLKDIRKHLKSGRPLHGSKMVRSYDDGKTLSDSAQCFCDGGLDSDHAEAEHPLKVPVNKEISESMLMQWMAIREQNRQSTRKKKAERKKAEPAKRRKSKAREMLCSIPNLNCFTHDNSHWRTEPFWTLGPFCFCQNSYNNSYWCLRTVNQTHNFLYCEFVTGFVSYYDLNADPFQLHNMLVEIEVPILEQLSSRLDRLRRCKGAAECEAYSTPYASLA